MKRRAESCFQRHWLCTPGHEMLQSLHSRPNDPSTHRIRPLAGAGFERLTRHWRPLDASICGQTMLQVTAEVSLVSRNLPGNRQSRTQPRAGRVGSSAAGALDDRAEGCGERGTMKRSHDVARRTVTRSGTFGPADDFNQPKPYGDGRNCHGDFG